MKYYFVDKGRLYCKVFGSYIGLVVKSCNLVSVFNVVVFF